MLVGLDISPNTGIAYAAFGDDSPGGTDNLYRINLRNGAATLLGAMGNGLLNIGSIAVLPHVSAGAPALSWFGLGALLVASGGYAVARLRSRAAASAAD